MPDADPRAGARGGKLVLSLDPVAGRESDARAWHGRIASLARRFDGLVEIHVTEPVPGHQQHWTQVLAFAGMDDLRRFLDDADCARLLAEAPAATGTDVDRQVVADLQPATTPVTVVVSQRLKPGVEAAYRKWQLKVDEAARRFPGFLGTELVAPVPGVQEEWVVVFRFDSAGHLDSWFASDVHAALMKEAEPFYETVQVRRVGRGFEDWFANAAGAAQGRVPQWKMAMVVLLILFPTVMLISLTVAPQIAAWPFPLVMFASNILSVVFMTWIAMPLATRALKGWLRTDRLLFTAFGAVGLCLLYAAAVELFLLIRG